MPKDGYLHSQMQTAARNHQRIHKLYNLPPDIEPGSREDKIHRLHALQTKAHAERYQVLLWSLLLNMAYGHRLPWGS